MILTCIRMGRVDVRRCAFSTVPSEVSCDGFGRKRSTRRRPSLLFCGDDRHAKKIAARLIRDVGLEPVDAGPPRVAWDLEPFLSPSHNLRAKATQT